MVNIGSNGNRIAYGIKHFNLDEVADISQINKATLTPGSTVFIISTSKYYMLNGQKKWVEINPFSLNGSGSGSGGGSGDNPGGSDNNYDGGSIDGSDPV